MNSEVTFVLIDDSPIDVMVHKVILTKQLNAVNIIHFENAKKGIEYIKETHTAETKNKTIILLDVQMPVMTGIEFLQHFEKLDKKITDQLEIVVISSTVNKEEINSISANPSVRKFISKPLTKENSTVIADLCMNLR